MEVDDTGLGRVGSAVELLQRREVKYQTVLEDRVAGVVAVGVNYFLNYPKEPDA